MKEYEATPVGEERYRLAESPYYDVRRNRWSWVDILAGTLYTLSQDGYREAFDFGHPIGAAVPLDRHDGFLIAGWNGLYTLRGQEVRLLYDLGREYAVYQRSNDAKADHSGRLYFGAMVNDEIHDMDGALYCYDHGTVRCLQKGTKIANGMAWSGDRKHFYFADSGDHCVYVYDYHQEDGAISRRDKLFSIEDGAPDGMCIDAQDNLWVAVWGGRRVECRSSKNGELLAVVRVPAEHVSSCCFSGYDLKKLFITSSGEGLDGPYDGCLFECPVDTRGNLPDYASEK